MNAIVEHHKRKAAREAVTSALLSGDLVRPSACSACGTVGATEAHHASYEPDRWLDVLWLCRTCHGALHRGVTRGRGPIRARKPPVKSALGDVLRSIRVAVGLTGVEAAARGGISHATVSRWENGRRRPDSLRHVREYVRAIGRDAVDLDAVERAFVADSEHARTERYVNHATAGHAAPPEAA